MSSLILLISQIGVKSTLNILATGAENKNYFVVFLVIIGCW